MSLPTYAMCAALIGNASSGSHALAGLARLLERGPLQRVEAMVDTLWDARRSVHHVTELALSNISSSVDCLWLLVQVEASVPEREENKVKLLDLTCYQ